MGIGYFNSHFGGFLFVDRRSGVLSVLKGLSIYRWQRFAVWAHDHTSCGEWYLLQGADSVYSMFSVFEKVSYWCWGIPKSETLRGFKRIL